MKPKNGKSSSLLFVFAFMAMAFTGFGQLPLYNRYYLSDMPGMGWSSDYALTHILYYLFAIFFLAFFTYKILDYFL